MSRSVVRMRMQAHLRRPLRLLVPVAGLLCGMGARVLPLGAQQTVASESRARGTSESESVLARPVTIQLDKVSLKQAVQEIAAQASVRVQFRARLLEAVVQPVTLHAVRMPLGAAYSTIFQGTSLRVVPVGADFVTITADPDAVQREDPIVGRIVNAKTKQPLTNVVVVVDDQAKGVRTGEDGRFQILAAPGEHRVTVRAVGFVKQTQIVVVTVGQTTTVDFALDASASVLDEVVVTGTVVPTERKAIVNPITVITAADIEKRGITRVEQLFRGDVPGVIALDMGTQAFGGQTQNGGQDTLGMMTTSQVYARGASSTLGSPTPLKTYVDGVELLNSSYLGTIDPKTIERIEIITGPQAATVYGSGAMGGVMQIFTKKGTGGGAPEMTVSLRYGTLESNLNASHTPTHNDALGVTGGVAGEFSYAANLSYNYTGQWQPQLFVRGYGGSAGVTYTRGPVTASGTYSAAGSTNGTYGRGNGVASRLGDRARQNQGDGFYAVTVSPGYFAQRISTATSQTATLNVDYRVSDVWQHHVVLGKSQNQFGLIPEIPAFTTSADTLYTTSKSFGQRTTASYNTTLVPLRSGFLTTTLTGGVSGTIADQTQFTACKPKPSTTTYAQCSGQATFGITSTLNDQNWGGFSSLQIGIADRVFATAAVRLEGNPAYGKDVTFNASPTYGITYTLEHGDFALKMLASYGRATRPPLPSQRLEQRYVSSGYDPAVWVTYLPNPNLNPEYSSGPQGGIELYYGNVGSITVNRYRQKVQDLIQQVPVDSFLVTYLAGGTSFYVPQSMYMNTETVEQQGWEGTGTVNIAAFTVKGTYSWSRSRVLSSPYGALRGRPFYGLPAHAGSVMISYARGGTSLALYNNFIGGTIRIENFGSAWWREQFQRRLMIDSENRNLIAYESNVQKVESRPGYVKSDLTGSQRLRSWVSATLNITNVGNNFQSDGERLDPTLGRQTSLGLSLRFPRR